MKGEKDMIFNIEIDKNKKVLQDEIVVNQYENEIDELHFKLPFEDFSYVAVFKSPNDKKLEFPIVKNKIVIDKSITSIPGQWNLIVVGQKDETVFVSNTIELRSCRNFLNMKNMQETDANIELLYAEIQETLNKLNDTGIEEISSLVDELKTINEKLDDTQLKESVSEVSNKADTAISKLDCIIADLSSLSANLGRLEVIEAYCSSIEMNMKGLYSKVDEINYTDEFLEIKTLLTDANSVADAIL